MASVQTRAATLDDLARVADKAELIDGRIELLMPTGRKPGRIAGRIYRSLDDYATQSGRGEAYPDNVGFAVSRLSSGASRLLLMRPITSGHFPPTQCGSWKALPHWLSRSVARTTTLHPRRLRSPTNARIISRPGQASSGTSIPSRSASMSIGPTRPIDRAPSGAGKPSMQNPCSPRGASMSIGSSPDVRSRAGCRSSADQR